MKELKCPKCGASVSPYRDICEYCRSRYTVVPEPKTALSEDYAGCDTFKRLQPFKKEVERITKEGKPDDLLYLLTSSQGMEATRILEACRVCHIKNCEFFNKNLEDFWPDLAKSLFLGFRR